MALLLVLLIVLGLIFFLPIACGIVGGGKGDKFRYSVKSLNNHQLKKEYEAQMESEEMSDGRFDASYFDELYDEMRLRKLL